MDETKRLKEFLALVLVIILFGLFSKITLVCYAGIAMGIAGLLNETFVKFVSFIWTKVSAVLGLFMGTIILSGIYFFVLTPVAKLYRVFNRDLLHIKKAKRTTLFDVRNVTYKPKDLEHPW